MKAAIRRASFTVPSLLMYLPMAAAYVLDAGNSRIQVFGADGSYITHWGRRGSAVGEFDFGIVKTGDQTAFSVALSVSVAAPPAGLAGSIVVDHEGFI